MRELTADNELSISERADREFEKLSIAQNLKRSLAGRPLRCQGEAGLNAFHEPFSLRASLTMPEHRPNE
jgi:hypothetical protein